MNIQKVTAIFDEFRLKDVEETLIRHGVKGFTLHPVRGRGEYFDSFNENHLIKHIQMEIYARSEHANDIAQPSDGNRRAGAGRNVVGREAHRCVTERRP